MKSTTAWGGALELLALTRILRTNVVVLTPCEGGLQASKVGHFDSNDPIILLMERHYRGVCFPSNKVRDTFMENILTKPRKEHKGMRGGSIRSGGDVTSITAVSCHLTGHGPASEVTSVTATIWPKIITVLTRYRPIVLELI